MAFWIKGLFFFERYHFYVDISLAISLLTVMLTWWILKRQISPLEKTLREREALLLESQTIAGLGNYVLDIKTGNWDSSDVCDQVFGIDKNYPHDIKGWVGLIHSDDQVMMNEYFAKEVLGKNQVFNKVYRIIRPRDNVIRFVHGLGRLEWDEKGQAIKMLGTIQDITERIMIEQSLRAAKEKAEESDHLKSAFLSNMSHEIRTPMNGIIGFLDLLSIPNLSEEDRKNYINMVNTSSKRLLNTINDILDISKLDAGQTKVKLEPMKPYGLIQDLYMANEKIFSKKNVEFKIQVEQELKSLLLICDEQKIYQILNNLLTNACKFTEKGKVEFGYKICSEEILFFVKDTGRGIASDQLLLVFDRFYQEDIYREGSGLGLDF
jgi:signal transduction histidine kinase